MKFKSSWVQDAWTLIDCFIWIWKLEVSLIFSIWYIKRRLPFFPNAFFYSEGSSLDSAYLTTRKLLPTKFVSLISPVVPIEASILPRFATCHVLFESKTHSTLSLNKCINCGSKESPVKIVMVECLSQNCAWEYNNFTTKSGYR